MGLGEAVTVKDAWMSRATMVLGAVDQVAVSPVGGSTASSFVPRAKACRSGARGDGWEARW